MRAELRGLHPNDFPDWETFASAARPDPTDGHGWFSLYVGAEGGNGSDVFQMHVATPKAASSVKAKGERSFRGVVVESFEPEIIEAALQAYVASVSGSDWPEIVRQLRHDMLWEYEGREGMLRPRPKGDRS